LTELHSLALKQS
jgi:hypothetical protein